GSPCQRLTKGWPSVARNANVHCISFSLNRINAGPLQIGDLLWTHSLLKRLKQSTRGVGKSTQASGAALNDDVLIMSKKQLDQLTKNPRAFFNGFRKVDLRDLSENKIEEHLRTHKLTVDDLTSIYGQRPIAHKAP
ncbi:MAG TPA: hypothetical protein VLE46_03885, partial [Nitrospira sp.]|nr:hypothetical protein [Nitrospira sp.]